MAQRNIHERYEDISPKRIFENPRSEDEEQFADAEAQKEAQKIWERLERAPRHRERIVKLLAEEWSKGSSRKDAVSNDESLL